MVIPARPAESNVFDVWRDGRFMYNKRLAGLPVNFERDAERIATVIRRAATLCGAVASSS